MADTSPIGILKGLQHKLQVTCTNLAVNLSMEGNGGSYKNKELDGVITKDEILLDKGLRDKLFRELDTNSDGRITYAEILANVDLDNVEYEHHNRAIMAIVHEYDTAYNETVNKSWSLKNKPDIKNNKKLQLQLDSIDAELKSIPSTNRRMDYDKSFAKLKEINKQLDALS